MPYLGFQNDVDIANRCLQHLGAPRITTFADGSKEANETYFIYDKVREAELRRNLWKFTTKRSVIRPIEPTTVVLAPALWSSTTTYSPGAIVIDQNGVLWINYETDNLNDMPGNQDSNWELYFGPLTVQPYDVTGQTGYYPGELVYEAPGNGNVTVFLCLATNSANASPATPGNTEGQSFTSTTSQDPGVATQWVNTVTYMKDNIVQQFATWAIGTTYAAGAGVNYNGVIYISAAAGNVGNEPDKSPALWFVWNLALLPPAFDVTLSTTYTLGQMVMSGGSAYISTANGNIGNAPPGTDWTVITQGALYRSLIDFSVNNSPASAPSPWVSTTAYTVGNVVAGSNGITYTALGNTTGNNPVTDNGVHWSTANVKVAWATYTGTLANSQWVAVPVAVKDLDFTYPAGCGPTFEEESRNVYMLPAGFLRTAPQDPKAGSVSFLGAPSGRMYDDWLYEGNFLITRWSWPITYRFVANYSDVSGMDPMFCEGLAARMAFELCETFTQSGQKKSQLQVVYGEHIAQARMANGIEIGAVEPAEDDYITCRI